MDEQCSFSKSKTELQGSISGTLLRSFLSHKPSRISPRFLKQSCSSRVALQLRLLQLVTKLNGLGVIEGGILECQCIFEVVLSPS
jgi:hypothetical protein